MDTGKSGEAPWSKEAGTTSITAKQPTRRPEAATTNDSNVCGRTTAMAVRALTVTRSDTIRIPDELFCEFEHSRCRLEVL